MREYKSRSKNHIDHILLIAPTNHLGSARCMQVEVAYFSTTRSPGQEKLFIWPPFFQYNKRLLRQKTGGACLYMPQDGH